MEVGMVRLDCLAERFLKSLSVVIRTSTKQLVKRFHRRALDLLEGIVRKPPHVLMHTKKSARPN
jgi:hypothetical protein